MKIIFLILLLATSGSAQTQKLESIYTDLAAKKCRTVESRPDESGSYRGLCAGAGGYRLEVLEGDLRQTINVVAPNRKKFELNLWTDVSGGFSSLGEKAEWRVARKNGKVVPIALIVRFNASENPEDSSRITSYLIVSRISANKSCITDVIKPGANANAEARKSADGAPGKPCRVSN